MIFEVQSYNLKLLQNQLVRRCINDHPKATYVEIAELLGVSERTVYRAIKASDEFLATLKEYSLDPDEFIKTGAVVNRKLGAKRGRQVNKTIEM